jgi:hypothetical protein
MDQPLVVPFTEADHQQIAEWQAVIRAHEVHIANLYFEHSRPAQFLSAGRVVSYRVKDIGGGRMLPSWFVDGETAPGSYYDYEVLFHTDRVIRVALEENERSREGYWRFDLKASS